MFRSTLSNKETCLWRFCEDLYSVLGMVQVKTQDSRAKGSISVTSDKNAKHQKTRFFTTGVWWLPVVSLSKNADFTCMEEFY